MTLDGKGALLRGAGPILQMDLQPASEAHVLRPCALRLELQSPTAGREMRQTAMLLHPDRNLHLKQY